jgi:TPR repeat protein
MHGKCEQAPLANAFLSFVRSLYPVARALARAALSRLKLERVSEAPMFGLYRFIAVTVLLSTAVISPARAQCDSRVNRIRERDSMYALGVMLDEGFGVELDERRAFQSYRRAAELGHAESMNRLGILYLQGRGVLQNTLSARSWFRLAAAQGSVTAINNIALLYFYGLGVPQSYSKAARALRISAQRGNADGQNKLGMMYASGLGVAPDQRRAWDLFLKSAAQGYSPAMVNLGLMLTQGSNANTRDVLPRPFMRRSNAAAGIQQALLNQSDIGLATGPR